MPDLQERLYCSEQIHIPPTFPYIMKLYCKAAIRTQPYDLLKWSAAYFRALANGEEPPVKERVEYPPFDSPTGLTPGYIKILIKQFGKDPGTVVSAQTLFQKWSDICLDEMLLVKLIALLGANTTVKWVFFVGVCAGFISKSLTQTMILLCELFTEEPEGGTATVPYDLFVDLYSFLARMDCGPLTEKEIRELEEIMYEEDICEVADKIKQGQYEGETEGEAPYGVEVKVSPEVEGEESEEFKSEEEAQKKESEEFSYDNEETTREGEVYPEKSEEDKEGEMELEPSSEGDGEGKAGEKSTSKEESTKSVEGEEEEDFEKVVEDASEIDPVTPSILADLDDESEESETKDVQGAEPQVTSMTEETKETKRINIEDLEDEIRQRIEEKLAAEVESTAGEEREFEELGTYILGAASRVPKFTAEALGFKIFRKYMRQEVPGIGPVIDKEQVENVIDFMDVWANKQEQMIMPRNIRHWMCPPLDKVPTPEP